MPLSHCYCRYVTSVMSDSVRPHRRQPTRLRHPWDSLGKNTGVGCHFLLQCMKVRSESEVAQSCPTLSDPMDCILPGSSVHGIFQARVLEWGAIASSAPLPLGVHKTGWRKRSWLPGLRAAQRPHAREHPSSVTSSLGSTPLSGDANRSAGRGPPETRAPARAGDPARWTRPLPLSSLERCHRHPTCGPRWAPRRSSMTVRITTTCATSQPAGPVASRAGRGASENCAPTGWCPAATSARSRRSS